ncbi:TlpA family protein disulfide reductase [Winogradskyella ursingii]|uniref:TlpA family protein disulfide reductase n=1 Tax=Winogradskyella ursingii TaxID=2686079 RepID=UPI0015CAC0C8|nr:TlpA disulfide reductase family protein [Winogradskyella ursingii]
MKQILLMLFVASVFSCKNEKTETATVETKSEIISSDEKTPVNYPFTIYDYDGLEPLINKEDDKVHVVNFWATWCAPCVKELPYFEAINKKYDDDELEVLLVSLDFPKNYGSKLVPFLEKHDLQSQVVAFDDVDQNRWIPAINNDWSGAIPATIIYKGDQRKFYEKSFTQEELETELKQFLK